MSEFGRTFPPDLETELVKIIDGVQDTTEAERAYTMGLLSAPIEVDDTYNSGNRIAYWIGHVINDVHPVVAVVQEPRADMPSWYCGIVQAPLPDAGVERDEYCLDAATSVVPAAYSAMLLLPGLLERTEREAEPELVVDVIPSL